MCRKNNQTNKINFNACQLLQWNCQKFMKKAKILQENIFIDSETLYKNGDSSYKTGEDSFVPVREIITEDGIFYLVMRDGGIRDGQYFATITESEFKKYSKSTSI